LGIDQAPLAWKEREALAAIAYVGNPAWRLIWLMRFEFTRLRFPATQIFAQFRGQALFARQIIAAVFTHVKRLADKAPQAQDARKLGLTLRARATIGAPPRQPGPFGTPTGTSMRALL